MFSRFLAFLVRKNKESGGVIVVGFVVGLISGFVVGLVHGFVAGFLWGLAVGLIWGIVGGSIGGIVVGFVAGLGGLVGALVAVAILASPVLSLSLIAALALGILVLGWRKKRVAGSRTG